MLVVYYTPGTSFYPVSSDTCLRNGNYFRDDKATEYNVVVTLVVN